MANDEKLKLEAALRKLSQGRSVLRDNLYKATAPILRQRWEITQQDNEDVVFANVRWQLTELIKKLKAADVRQIATYSFNLTDDGWLHRWLPPRYSVWIATNRNV